MIRVPPALVALAAAALLVVTSWFAWNAPRLSQPSPVALGDVRLPAETPPLPPEPANLADALVGSTRRAALFAPARPDADAARPAQGPLASAWAPPPVAPSRSDTAEDRESRRPVDPLTAALAAPPPAHGQDTGAPALDPTDRKSDLEGVVVSGQPVGPAYAARPAPSPRRTGAAVASVATPEPKPEPEPEAAPESEARPEPAPQAPAPIDDGLVDAIAEAATQQAAPGAPEDEGMVLLGVFQSSGAGRALVRTADGAAVRVSPGDEVGGWRVADIGEDHIRLRRASQTRLLKLPTPLP